MRVGTVSRNILWTDQERTRDGLPVPDPVRGGGVPEFGGDLVVEWLRVHGRVPRMCLYTVVTDGTSPELALDLVRPFAEKRQWQVGRSYADCGLWSTCAARLGWNLVRGEIRAGRADGVVLLSRSDVGPHIAEFTEQLAWFEGRRAFIAVAEPGVAGCAR